MLAACGAAPDKPLGKTAGPPTLSWYVGPDRVNAAALARSCSNSSGGAYRITVRKLPVNVGQRHRMLVRRLAAKDTSIDLLSLDSAFTAEFSAARFLAPVPEDLVPAYSKDIAPAALSAASYDGQLVAVPWWFDPQLLWYRGNLAERAGLDTTKAIAWEDLIAGADRLGVTVQIEDRDGGALTEWVDALVTGNGRKIVGGNDRAATVGLDTDAGRAAAAIIEFYTESAVGPGPSADAVKDFTVPDGGFLLASSSVIADPALAPVASDLNWTAYPAAANFSVAPLAGVALAVPLYAPRSDLSYRAATCLTSATAMAEIMTSAGHSSSRLTTYDDPAVKTNYPMAAVTRKAVETGRAVPSTPYWQLVRAAIGRTWMPLREVSSGSTPGLSQAAVRAALAGELQ